jgi:hypothetical protein
VPLARALPQGLAPLHGLGTLERPSVALLGGPTLMVPRPCGSQRRRPFRSEHAATERARCHSIAWSQRYHLAARVQCFDFGHPPGSSPPTLGSSFLCAAVRAAAVPPAPAPSRRPWNWRAFAVCAVVPPCLGLMRCTADSHSG